MEPSKVTSVNSRTEELFVQLFCEAFGPEKQKTCKFSIRVLTFTVGIGTSTLHWSRLNPKLQSRLAERLTTTPARFPRTSIQMTF